MINSISSIIVMFSLLLCLCSCGNCQNNNSHVYLANLKSKDIGDVRFYLELNIKDSLVSGGSIKNAYSGTYSFLNRIKINLFSGIKDKRLINIKGYCIENKESLELNTIFYSPIGNYYFNATIKGDSITGKLLTGKELPAGEINGYLFKENSYNQITSYKNLSDEFITEFEKNFFDSQFLLSSKYKKLKKNLTYYSSNSIDDLHYVFSVFYYLRSMPYSHIALWREDSESIPNEIKNINYKKNGDIGILSIISFAGKEGEMEKIMEDIIDDKPSSLIIDLRNNGGGNIGPAIELAKYLISKPTSGGYFLTKPYFDNKRNKKDDCYIFSQGNIDNFMEALNSHECVNVRIEPNDKTFTKPIYILTNNRTASTCEPIVYALSSDDNILVVGQNTAGKMLSAKEIKLSNGFKLFVPNADYVTDDNIRLDQLGVKPEVKIKKKIDALEFTINNFIK